MRRYPWLALFGIAMAFLESAVVVYLRALYYPKGFDFPIVLIPGREAWVEVAREGATVIMLYVAGRLGAQTAWQQFAGFMFLFGVWDIFYYVWLKVILGWPSSLLTWDILFLIPVPWIGPVLAPVIVSISLVGAALAIEAAFARGARIHATALEWFGVAAAGLIVILSFTLDWRSVVAGARPADYHWEIFWIGEALGLGILVRGVRRWRSSGS